MSLCSADSITSRISFWSAEPDGSPEVQSAKRKHVIGCRVAVSHGLLGCWWKYADKIGAQDFCVVCSSIECQCNAAIDGHLLLFTSDVAGWKGSKIRQLDMDFTLRQPMCCYSLPCGKVLDGWCTWFATQLPRSAKKKGQNFERKSGLTSLSKWWLFLFIPGGTRADKCRASVGKKNDPNLSICLSSGRPFWPFPAPPFCSAFRPHHPLSRSFVN